MSKSFKLSTNLRRSWVSLDAAVSGLGALGDSPQSIAPGSRIIDTSTGDVYSVIGTRMALIPEPYVAESARLAIGLAADIQRGGDAESAGAVVNMISSLGPMFSGYCASISKMIISDAAEESVEAS